MKLLCAIRNKENWKKSRCEEKLQSLRALSTIDKLRCEYEYLEKQKNFETEEMLKVRTDEKDSRDLLATKGATTLSKLQLDLHAAKLKEVSSLNVLIVLITTVRLIYSMLPTT